MKFLFIHQNFPAQFVHLAPALVKQGHECVALTLRVKERQMWNGVEILPYSLEVPKEMRPHPWLINLNSHVVRGHSFFLEACKLRDGGFTPDVVIAHPGWGESLFVKDVWPDARVGLFCEFYNGVEQSSFEGEPTPDDILRLRMKNITNHLHFAIGDAGVSPTVFQADSFPAPFREKISVIHDGIDTEKLAPDENAVFEVEGVPVLSRKDEVITFVNRNLEPYRGYHIFMRALPELLKRRPNAQFVVVGGDDVSYGARPPKGETWKQIYIDEVRGQISDADWARVHFPGRIPYDQFQNMLKVTKLHIYLTYPFVLSWSLLEAMSCGAAIVASDTPPLHEVMEHDVTGRLVPFADQDALVDQVCAVLDDPESAARMGACARAHVIENYDLRSVCLPRMLEWVHNLAEMPAQPPEFVAR